MFYVSSILQIILHTFTLEIIQFSSNTYKTDVEIQHLHSYHFKYVK